MKFRGKVQDIACIQSLQRLTTGLSKLSRLWGLRLTTDKLQFIVPAQASQGGINILTELPQTSIFDEYLMEGVSSDYNEIYLEVCSEGLSRALKSAVTAKSLKIKLTKRHGPCLTLEIELPSLSGRTRLVVHDVPVQVIPRRLWDIYHEPTVPSFDITFHMPAMKVLKNVVDKMKNIAKFVELRGTLSCATEAEMSLCIRTELVNVSTHFRQLQTPRWKNDTGPAGENPTRRDTAAVAVDLTKLSQLLTCQTIGQPSNALMSIVHTEMVHVYLAFGDTTIQYFLPSMAS